MIPIAFPLATDEQIRMINSYIENNTNLITGIKSCLKEINRESKGVLVLMGYITNGLDYTFAWFMRRKEYQIYFC